MHRSSGRSRRAVFGIAGALLAFGVLAAACGSDDSGSSAGTTASGGGAATTASGGAATTAAAAETPVAGGKLVVGIEADTGSPWEPSKMLCATSCYVTIGSVYDTLTSVTEDGKFVPYLADSVTPNADYTVWTFHARDGVKFHDGTPFDGAAMVDNMKRQIASFLTGKVFSDVATNADGSPQVVAHRSDDDDDHDEAALGRLPALPRRAAGHDREPDVARGG